MEEEERKQEKIIRISPQTYNRLLQLAVIEQDKTHEDIINRLIDENDALKQLVVLQYKEQQQQRQQRKKRKSTFFTKGPFTRYSRLLEEDLGK